MNKPEQEVHTRGEDEPEEVGTQLAEIPRDSMVDGQVATAKRYPRSIARFRKEVISLACLDEESAGACLYALVRSGKTIEGPSARFAEILLYSWGNSRAEAAVVEEGPTHLKAQGTYYDLERNVAVRKTVQRRITDKNGRRYNDDMIGVTGNAAISIALRNAVFAGIPKAIWKGMYEQARLASLGKGGTLTQTRQKMIEYYGKLGIKPEQLYALLEVEGLEDVKEDQIITLRGLATAIKDGETTLEDIFNPRATGGVETPNLQDRLRKKAEPAGAAAANGEPKGAA